MECVASFGSIGEVLDNFSPKYRITFLSREHLKNEILDCSQAVLRKSALDDEFGLSGHTPIGPVSI